MNPSPQPPNRTMPDGTTFELWEQPAVYRKTYHVSRHHPLASDENPGSRERPFKTIDRAAQVLRPGERVRVASGVYRERIRPRRGGTGPGAMIGYEAAPGARVIVSGSRLLDEAWTPAIDAHGKAFSLKLWMARLPETLFEGGESPFQMQNASEADIALMPWAEDWAGRVPYTLRRGLVFQDGRRLAQLATYEDLARVPGSYWVAEDGQWVHIHPFDAQNPNAARMEVTAQQHLLKPATTDLGYIRVSGFIFEHAGNGLPRTGVGALDANGGHHWIIEENVVRHVNAVGIEIGARTDESRAGGPTDRERAEANPGHMIVRNNTLYDCGTGGIQGLRVKHALVHHNHIHHCGWQDAEQYWECAAIKLLLNEGTLVSHNLIHHIEAASGIWLDFANRSSRVTGNVIHTAQHIAGSSGAIYIEASQQPNMVDNNVLWNVRGTGVCLNDTDEAIVAHNLLAESDVGISARVNTHRTLGGRPLTSRRNRVHHNLFYRVAMPVQFGQRDNECDHNTFIEAATGFGLGPWRAIDRHLQSEVAPGEAAAEALERLTLAQWQAQGWDAHSTTLEAALELEAATWLLRWEAEAPLPRHPAAVAVDGDFWGQGAQESETQPGDVRPGPFQSLAETQASLRLHIGHARTFSAADAGAACPARGSGGSSGSVRRG